MGGCRQYAAEPTEEGNSRSTQQCPLIMQQSINIHAFKRFDNEIIRQQEVTFSLKY